MNILNSIKERLFSVYAHLLSNAQETKWWTAHLAEKEEIKWKELCNEISTLLPKDEKYAKIASQFFQIQCDHIRAETKNSPNQNLKPRALLLISAYTIRSLMPLLSIVGIQPLQGPVGLVYNMKFINHDPGSGEMDKKMSLEIVRTTVTAQSRRLAAKFSIEALQDLTTFHPGIDAEAEIAHAMGQEIACEIINEVIANLISLASENGVIEVKETVKSEFIGDRHQVIGVKLNQAALDIADKTRRGPGNFVVTSPLNISILQTLAGHKFVPAPKDVVDYGNYGSFKFMGTLNETIKVYSTVTQSLQNKILVGYLGNEMDTGYVYAPYTVVMSSGVVVDPATFNPMLTLMTRYGTSTSDESKNYYRLIDVGNLTFI